MFQPSRPTSSAHAIHRVVEAVLRLLSIYTVPLVVALLSVVALGWWSDRYVDGSGQQQLHLRVVADAGERLDPQGALRLLDSAPPVDYYETHLSEAPLWFLVATRGGPGDADYVEFPSRHALHIRCWDPASLQPLGEATRASASGALSAVKAGFAVRLWNTPTTVLCRATFAGPAHLTAVQWPAEQLLLSSQHFHRNSGLLDGGMIVLTVFILVTALINRQVLYLQFAAWLVLNLRVGSLSAGWDVQWLGQTVPENWLLPGRAISMALYAIATVTLYMTLFGTELLRTRFSPALRITQWMALALLPLAIVLPYGSFLPVMWVFVAIGLVLLATGLASIIMSVQSRVALWFGASFGVTLVSNFAEVIAAALGFHNLVGIANGVTAALASNLLAALAVAEQMRLETAKRIAAQAELEHAYEAMPLGLFTLDLYGHFQSANPALCAMLGAGEIVPGRTRWQQFFEDATLGRLQDAVHSRHETELELQSRDGDRRFLARATLAHGRIEGVLEDVTEKTKANEQLRFMANHDPLTKVHNRRGIEQMFEAAALSFASGKPLALAYVDLDRFKLINDLYGHAAGDEVLKQVCARMAMMLGGEQQIGRVGGDEFVIVMPDTPVPLASMICRSMVERLGQQPYRVGDKAFQVRGSIGLIEVSRGMALKDAVSAADRACREAKAGAADGLVVYERGSAAFIEREAELKLVARLSGPKPTEDMFIEMQPIMSLKRPNESLNFEVLLRMREPDGTVITAAPVISAAEKSGRAGIIDRWVLASTLDWITANAARLANTRFVCMNLSGASLNDERFVQDTLEILAGRGAAAERLCIEITESVALHDLDNTRRFIEQVRAYGVKVALDDFGAGYTSFSYLKELPADVLKIDGNFIVNINAHPANVAIVEAIVSLAVNLGMKTIAEWAEDAATVRTLAEIGVDYVQGWAVARAQAPERLLQAQSSADFIDDPDVSDIVRCLASEPGQAGYDVIARVH